MAPVDGTRHDHALGAVRRELAAAHGWASGEALPGPLGRRSLAQVTGDLADAVATATRAGHGQQARHLLADAAARPVHPAQVDAWHRLLGTAHAVAGALAWPDGDPWGLVPGHAGQVPSSRAV